MSATDQPAIDLSTLPLTRIRPARGWIGLDFQELWQYRELFAFMVWRDIKIKYKQTFLGAGWAILVPFFNMLIFTLIFGRVAGLPSDGLPQPIFYYCALLPWTYFANSLAMAGNSLVGSSHLLTKIYFPRLIVPAGPCLAGLVDLAIAFLILIAMMIYYKIQLAASVVLLPLLVLCAFCTSLGTGLILSSLNVKYRDIKYIIPFLVQMWMYCTVIIPYSVIQKKLGAWHLLYGLNPMAGVVEGFRWSLLQRAMESATGRDVTAPWYLISTSMVISVLLLAAGLVYFKRMEKMFADIV